MSNQTVIGTMGIEATGFEETLTKSNLNWTPETDKVGGMDTGINMPNKKLLYRSDTREALGIVGSDYFPSQPREFLESQFTFAESCKGKVVRAGFIPDRSRAFAFVEYGTVKIPTKDRKVGDVMKAYIYSTDGWDGGTPRRCRLFVERLKCLNGMRSKEIKASLWVSHTSQMLTRYADRWKNFEKEIKTNLEQIKEQFTRLTKVEMNENQMKEFLVKLIPGDGGRVAVRRNDIATLFGQGGTANLGASRFDAYNAVTEYVTHQRTYRETDTTSAETNRFLGVLETDTLANQALSILLN